MTTYLVTGCAGFIGTTFVHYMLKKYTDIKIINLDALTYAGNLENLKDLEDDPRHIFVHGNICDKELVAKLIADYDPDYIIIEFTADKAEVYRYDGKGTLDAEAIARLDAGKAYENGYGKTHP